MLQDCLHDGGVAKLGLGRRRRRKPTNCGVIRDNGSSLVAGKGQSGKMDGTGASNSIEAADRQDQE